MEKWFKDQLDGMKNREFANFADEILPNAYWLEKSQFVVTGSQVSEKSIVVDSFVQFSKEKIAESKSSVVNLNNAEIKLKSSTLVDGFQVPDVKDVLKRAENFYSLKAMHVLESAMKNQPKVIFLNDEFQDASLVKSENWLDHLFPNSVSELFSKMLGAMKFAQGEQISFAIKPSGFAGNEAELKTLMYQIIYLLKPQYILSLGAWSTNFILNKQERLANVHGQFFDLNLPDIKTQVVPMFHPSILEANQNMKQSAWKDMQKVMKILGKI
jgi:hypothetical protein